MTSERASLNVHVTRAIRLRSPEDYAPSTWSLTVLYGLSPPLGVVCTAQQRCLKSE